jgi:transposase
VDTHKTLILFYIYTKGGFIGRHRYYDPEFKRESVRLVLEEGRSIRDVERSLGITFGLLKDWVKSRNGAALCVGASAPAGTEAKRIKELERKLVRVRMERDILKKAMAVFSTDLN